MTETVKNDNAVWDPLFADFIKKKAGLNQSIIINCVGGDYLTLHPPYTINESSEYICGQFSGGGVRSPVIVAVKAMAHAR